MRSEKWSMLGVFWALLGAGILVSAGIDAWDLALSEFADKVGIWLTIFLFALFGVGALAFGWQVSTPGTWSKALGGVLCVCLLLYTLFILAITPDHAIVRPLLAVQVFVIALATWTIVHLWRRRGPTAANLEQ